jgi:hypothetical protein
MNIPTNEEHKKAKNALKIFAYAELQYTFLHPIKH